MKKWLIIAGTLLAAIVVAFFWLRNEVSQVKAVKITDDLHMVTGLGGNVAVLATGEGSIVVDTMTFQMQGDAIREIAEQLTGEAVAIVINTHYHLDHTHGNPGFNADTIVIATDRTLAYLQSADAGYWQGDGRNIPNQTFTDELIIKLGDKTVKLVHPGRGHTDGDLVALFVEDRALHTGDLYLNRKYPNIDLESGGSVSAWGDTLDNVLALDFDYVIPGHGSLSDVAGLRQFQTFIRQLAAVGAKAATLQSSLVDTQVNGILTADEGYEEMNIPLLLNLDREFVITRTWEEATGAVKANQP